VKKLGAPRKHQKRETSITSAIRKTRSVISGAVRKGIERVMVFFAMAALPHLAPQIYMAYKLYNQTKTAIRAYEEYAELSETMTKKEAAITEMKRVAVREGAKQIVSEKIISKVVSTQLAALLTRPEFNQLTNNDEQVKYMLHATLCQFMIGAIEGSRDSLVQQASELIR
jgi:hypothetical protein